MRQVRGADRYRYKFRLQVQDSGFRGVNTLSFLQDKVKLWLNTALKKEEESWLSSRNPEIIDQYCFSPLAIDVIQVRHSQYRCWNHLNLFMLSVMDIWWCLCSQVIDSSLTEFSCVIRDQNKAQRITAHLESFLAR